MIVLLLKRHSKLSSHKVSSIQTGLTQKGLSADLKFDLVMGANYADAVFTSGFIQTQKK